MQREFTYMYAVYMMMILPMIWNNVSSVFNGANNEVIEAHLKVFRIVITIYCIQLSDDKLIRKAQIALSEAFCLFKALTPPGTPTLAKTNITDYGVQSTAL